MFSKYCIKVITMSAKQGDLEVLSNYIYCRYILYNIYNITYCSLLLFVISVSLKLGVTLHL